MDLKNIALVSAFAASAIGIGILLPKGELETTQIMPWQIEQTETGATRVFGLIIGESSLTEVEQRFHTLAEISLFAKPDGEYVTEVFFEKVEIGGLTSKVVIVSDLSQEELAGMFERGLRISTLGSGTQKVTLSSEDLQHIRQTSIASLTYLPRIDLEETLVTKRFGEPVDKITEIENNTTHWLYPDVGLDITMTPDGDAVLQYVPPQQFDELLWQPLRELQEEQEAEANEAEQSTEKPAA